MAREKRQPISLVDSKLKEGDLVLIKDHTEVSMLLNKRVIR